MIKKILFIKTFVYSGIGDSLPEIDLFCTASFIEKKYPEKYSYKFYNAGYDYKDENKFTEMLRCENFDTVLFSANIWELSNLYHLAKLVKKVNKNTVVIVSGQLASIVKERLLQNKDADIVIYGEPYNAFSEILAAFESGTDLQTVKGICFRNNNKISVTNEQNLYTNADNFAITKQIWDMVDIKKYSGQSGWNGLCKEKHYIPVISSFGCSFKCSYCTNRLYLGSAVRGRSITAVVDEIEYLTKKYGIYEIHFFDAVFNYDLNRAKEIMKEIIKRNLNISAAFPHGLRIDNIDDELITLFKKAGVYKLTYAIESGSAKIQKQINKNLNLQKAKAIIKKTAEQGIIVCGYFMLGFDNETDYEMKKTIMYACKSDFDIASFFKYSPMYDEVISFYDNNRTDLINFAYFSNNLNKNESFLINKNIILAQRKFYCNFKRLYKLFVKSKRKFAFAGALLKAFAVIIQGYIVSQFIKSR